jgi:hypothetical protein
MSQEHEPHLRREDEWPWGWNPAPGTVSAWARRGEG